jgi:hypothetical protein
MTASIRTPEEQAREDMMILHLGQAIEFGFSLATPGSSDRVRATHPDLFGTEEERDEAEGEYVAGSSDDIEIDDHPMVSRGDGGVWVSAWVWLQRPDEDDPDYDNNGNLKAGVDNT